MSYTSNITGMQTYPQEVHLPFYSQLQGNTPQKVKEMVHLNQFQGGAPTFPPHNPHIEHGQNNSFQHQQEQKISQNEPIINDMTYVALKYFENYLLKNLEHTDHVLAANPHQENSILDLHIEEQKTSSNFPFPSSNQAHLEKSLKENLNKNQSKREIEESNIREPQTADREVSNYNNRKSSFKYSEKSSDKTQARNINMGKEQNKRERSRSDEKKKSNYFKKFQKKKFENSESYNKRRGSQDVEQFESPENNQRRNRSKGTTGDWKCPNCGNINFSKRASCYRCSFFLNPSGYAQNPVVNQSP